MSLRIATFGREALPDLCRIWQAATASDDAAKSLLSEKLFDDIEIEDEQRLLASSADQPVGFAVGVTRDTVDDRRGFVKLIAVDPAYQRQGVGTRLLAELESTFDQAATIRIAESAPNYLSPGVATTNTPALTFFHRHGYERIGEALNQSVDLNGDFDTAADEERLRTAGFAISRATREHRPAIRGFLSLQWPSWVAEVEKTLSNDPISLHVAVCEEKIVGFAAFDANNLGTGWFGPMGTDPVCRGQGIGEVLLKRCLSDIKQQGLAQAIIPWVGPTEFYERTVGAVEMQRLVRLEKPCAS